mgnify:CR=1 FL=1
MLGALEAGHVIQAETVQVLPGRIHSGPLNYKGHNLFAPVGVCPADHRDLEHGLVL